VELPKMNLETMVIPNEFIHRKAKEYYEMKGTYIAESFKVACNEYNTYKKSAEKEVSYLVKEFECKKSADQYARSSTARTGLLDTSKLHTYKFNEDLFKRSPWCLTVRITVLSSFLTGLVLWEISFLMHTNNF